MRQSYGQTHGNAKVVAVAVLAAVGIAAKLAWEMYRSGARDPSYIIFMAFCAVIALAIVAPRRFCGRSDAEEQWGNEDEANRTLPETPMPADSDPSINRAKKGNQDGH